jgi:hypothetical protein
MGATVTLPTTTILPKRECIVTVLGEKTYFKVRSNSRNEDTDTLDNNNEEQILSDGEELDNQTLDVLNYRGHHDPDNNNLLEESNTNFDSVFSKIEHLLNGDKKNCGRSRSEGLY